MFGRNPASGHAGRIAEYVSPAWRAQTDTPWSDPSIIRADLFGTERLEHHAVSLAQAQPITQRAVRVMPLSARVRQNSAVLLSAYRSCTRTVQAGQPVVPATEWLLDNYHMVDRQLQQIANDLPPGYYRQLPKLATGPFAGYPRVLGIAWAYVAHTDSLLNGPVLARFVRAYQTVEPLTIGELWAVAITLRMMLVENMRRLAEQIIAAQVQRETANDLVDHVLRQTAHAQDGDIRAFANARAIPDDGPISIIFAAQVARRLRGVDSDHTSLQGWLQNRLEQQGLTPDDAVARAGQRQGASNVTMRNIVTSMRLITEMDWPDFVEAVSPVDASLRAGSDFAAMDFATRDMYRTEIEALARGSGMAEVAVADAVLALAAQGTTPAARDPGHGLIGPGRPALEHRIGYRAKPAVRLRRGLGRLGLRGYQAAIGLSALGITGAAIVLGGAQGWGAVALGLLVLGPAWEAGTALVNLAVTRMVPPRRLPGMELAHGIPPDFRSLVAVPVLLDTVEELDACLERLLVHHLSSTDGAVHYALLSDGPDAATETRPQDADLIAHATAAVASLNAAYPNATGDRFVFLHRHRQWNPSMGVWMGWERKRGKLTELNRLLRGATDTSFMAPCIVPRDVRFVITLDADTRLMRDTVRRLIGKLAHPLNAPHFDAAEGRVTRGYGILQPRVTPALPVGNAGSPYQRTFASHGGIDTYAAAVSDVYQDLFAEGSFAGKGIYDVDAFMAALEGRVPENTMLSHDLFEGVFARAALVSDIEVIEDFPARHDIAARRQHRWVRGDWQLLPWLVGARGTGDGSMPALGRWKIVDNLRRSLTAPLTLLALCAGWAALPLAGATVWTVMVLGMLSLPYLLALPFAIVPGRAEVTARSHLAALVTDARAATARVTLDIAFLPDTALRMVDAILRTGWRLVHSRRHLLEWTTAARMSRRRRPGIPGQYRDMAGGVTLGIGLSVGVVALNLSVWPLAGFFALQWLASPLVAARVSRAQPARVAASPTASEMLELRLIARRTWRFFETFVTAADNDLPPDNFQETPQPALARRTSPTNIGLYLLATTAAHDMGWIGRAEAVARLERTLATMQRMPRFRGHLYNWHATDDLRVLDPAYVSSVDSGNLAGHLIAVAQACAAWQRHPAIEADWRAGMSDTLLLARRALDAAAGSADKALTDLLDQISATVAARAPLDQMLPLCTAARARAAATMAPDADALFWITAAHTCLASHAEAHAQDLCPRLAAVERSARDFATGMEFGFLLDRDRMLLSIGFSVATNQRDTNCYDLLASEARLASLFAIAKGDIDTRHWFRLGRTATPLAAGSALVSWSGSMFEYLMPSLVMRAPEGSVLAECRRW